ncbi:MAG: PRTRC system protein D [Rubrivivax sp.]|nr:PRTRC system protein D [Rubrivivax sp.]
MEAIVRAIDVGFGNTKYVLAAQGGRVECAHFASIAYDSAHDNSNDALGSKRKTVCVPVGGMWYEVGPDVALAADGFVGRNHHDDYIRTPEYRAFTAGALHFMKVDRVDLLVLGLPVVDYMRRRAELQKAMTGKFEVGRNRTVEVKQVLVVAQPQGAMYAVFGDQANAKLRHGRTLVIDAGSRTFDWLVTLDSKVVGKMSDSVNRGVHDILLKIAAAIASETGRGYLNLEAIDRALRSRKPLRAYKRSVDLKKVRQHDREDRRPGRRDAPWQVGRDRRPGAHRGGGWRDAPVPRIDSAKVPRDRHQRGGRTPLCEREGLPAHGRAVRA